MLGQISESFVMKAYKYIASQLDNYIQFIRVNIGEAKIELLQNIRFQMIFFAYLAILYGIIRIAVKYRKSDTLKRYWELLRDWVLYILLVMLVHEAVLSAKKFTSPDLLNNFELTAICITVIDIFILIGLSYIYNLLVVILFGAINLEILSVLVYYIFSNTNYLVLFAIFIYYFGFFVYFLIKLYRDNFSKSSSDESDSKSVKSQEYVYSVSSYNPFDEKAKNFLY